jgi:hypothetical protein
LARWTILHPLKMTKATSENMNSIYTQLHLSILETLADYKESNNLSTTTTTKKSSTIPAKSLVLLIGKVEEALKVGDDTKADLDRDLALDRLGQFLHCLTSVGCTQGKLNEVCSSLKTISGSNRILLMYLETYHL